LERRAPCQEPTLAVVTEPITPVEIDAPFHPTLNLPNAQRRRRDSHLTTPELRLFVNKGGMLETGIPTGVQANLLTFLNGQVNPQIVWRNFEFPIAIRGFRIWGQENFRDIAIPKLP